MIRAYLQDKRGAAAAEFAIFLIALTALFPSAVDIGIYAYDTMQVTNSAQMGAQALWAACTQLPVTDTTNACPTASTAMATAGHQTSLGNNVTVTLTSEGYYCVGSNGQLVDALGSTSGTHTGDFTTALNASTRVPNAPGDCSKVSGGGALTTKPGDYVAVTATYTYSPVFPAVSAASILGTTITSTAWMRMQ